jgi:hypothetical protein
MTGTDKYWLVYRCRAGWHAVGPYPGRVAAREAAGLLICPAEAYVISGAVLDTLARRWRRSGRHPRRGARQQPGNATGALRGSRIGGHARAAQGRPTPLPPGRCGVLPEAARAG